MPEFFSTFDVHVPVSSLLFLTIRPVIILTKIYRKCTLQVLFTSNWKYVLHDFNPLQISIQVAILLIVRLIQDDKQS